MIIKENNCVGCAECIGCGRKRSYYIHVCDECESDDQLYKYEGKELCAECLLGYFDEVNMENFD